MAKDVLTGYVIHRRPYRETSQLVDIFTREDGRVSVVAKGVRGNAKSAIKSILQPLQLVEFECFGRSNLRNLGRIELVDKSLNCSGKALYAAFYINELIQRALPESEAIESLFYSYEHTLKALSSQIITNNKQLEPILRRFELQLLSALGHLPDLTHDALSGNEVSAQKSYTYSADEGAVETKVSSRHAISGAILLEIDAQNFSAQSLWAAKYICRLTLPQAIGDKPIKSRDLFV